MKKIRCAIYTRKSSEEGLDQDFNSLDAQREACSAYIRSQKQEGWVLLDRVYDDGGLSGGTMNRPTLQRLLQDVDDGLVDQIVVYKIDRLTRSLTDFAKLVDRLDKQNTSFVSVTQSFNTATSMGRLTLNVLLSFAQFEREVTAEPIRGKIAPSRRRACGWAVWGCLLSDWRHPSIISNWVPNEVARYGFSARVNWGTCYAQEHLALRAYPGLSKIKRHWRNSAICAEIF